VTPLIPALAGALLVAGLIGIIAGLRRTPQRPPAPQR
jgi:tight adherence protein B